MTFTVTKARLHQNGSPVTYRASPNHKGTLRPLYLLMHYTAGTTAEGAINHFLNPQAQASAHLVIDRDGTMTQMVDFNRVAWHAGKSKWEDLTALNPYSIGIELVNGGKLRRSGDGRWLTWANRVIPDSEVILATHKHETKETGWHVYPEAQLDATIAVGVALRKAYAFLDVLGHDDVSPGRKVDPGPAFPMISVQSQIMGRL
jgi:N-acetylmuramoyl-L-alanine amidase